MVELTFGELKQGLICCVVNRNCAGCPLYLGPEKGPHEECTYKLMAASLSCINTFEQDLAKQVKRANDWEDTANMHERALIELRESLDRR